MSTPIPYDDDPEQTRTGDVKRLSGTGDEFDACVAELVSQIDCVAREEPDPAAGGLIPLSAAVPARRASLDTELDRILNRLELLYDSLERNRARPDSGASERSRPSYREKRASVSLFASQVRTQHRREYVVGLSVALNAPLGRLLFISSAILMCVGLWVGAQRFDTPVAAQSDIRVLPPAPMPLPAHAGAQISDIAPSSPISEPPLEKPVKVDPPRVVPIKPEHKIRVARQVPNLTPAVPEKEGRIDPAQLQSADAGNTVPAVQNPVLNKIWTKAQDLTDGNPAVPQTQPPTAAAPPVPSMKIGAAYPEEARRMGIKGAVELTVYIDDKGKPVRAEVVSGPALLHAAAVECIMQWHFKPTIVDGVAVPASGRYSINFE